MAKKRGQHGGERGTDSALESAADLLRAPEVDPAVHEQGHLGNAVLQARMGGEPQRADPEAGLVAEVARPAVERAMLVLQLEPHDASRTERLTQILERSNLPDKHEIQMRIETDATMRAAVDGVLDAAIGGHDAQARWAVDAALHAVSDSLTGSMVGGQWVDATGPITLPEAAQVGSLADRSAAVIEALADARAPQMQGGGRAVASLVRSLALVATLDEDEEEEEWVASSPELG